MQTPANDIQPGWEAVGTDGHRIGTVEDVGINYVVIEKSLIAGDVYVPAHAVASIDLHAARVVVDVRRDDVDAQGWTKPPIDSDTWEGWESRTSDERKPRTAESIRSDLASGAATTDPSS
jgi:hypothetical protein